MSRNWSSAALDDFVVDPRLARVAQSPHGVGVRPDSRRLRVNLELPLMCILAGAIAALLYVWPVLLISDIMAGGFRPRLFGAILAVSAVLASLAFWVITVVERRYWARRRHTLSDFADPPPWK